MSEARAVRRGGELRADTAPNGEGRSRLFWIIAAVAVVPLGWWGRSPLRELHPSLAEAWGSGCYALLLFCGAASLVPRVAARWPARFSMTLALLNLMIEVQQAWSIEWLAQLRATSAGRWILGTTYSTVDLLGALLGVAAGTLLLLPKRSQ